MTYDSNTCIFFILDKLDTIPDFRECDYNLFSEDLSKCYRGLKGITGVTLAFDPARFCP